MRRLAFVLFVAISAIGSAQSGWNRYRVTAFIPSDVQRLANSDLGLFSEALAIGETDMIVGPGEFPKLLALNLPYRFVSALPDPRGWDQHPQPDADYRNAYLRYDVVVQQYEDWRLQNPAIVTKQAIGTTWLGRTIWAYRVRSISANPTPTHAVVVINGIHAREWISPAVGLHLFRKTIDNFTMPGVRALIPPGTALYFIPSLNPDGYEYSWTSNRMWRKNRRNNGGSFGVDLNRNFATGWGLDSGSSGTPSSETYRGPSAFSEPETTALKNFSESLPPVRAFVDYHSYGQLILWPWSYTEAQAPGNAWLTATGNAIRNGTVAVNGRNYVAGQSSTTLYLVSGGSKDWYYDRFNAAAYSVELRDTGSYGFLLPENQITPTQDEAWGGFKELLPRILNR